MTDDELMAAVRGALMATKSDTVILESEDLAADTVLAESPVVLDSLEFVELVTRIEEALGVPPDDDHLTPHSLRTIGELVVAARQWLSAGGTATVTGHGDSDQRSD